jgi:hypothetical protein
MRPANVTGFGVAAVDAQCGLAENPALFVLTSFTGIRLG